MSFDVIRDVNWLAIIVAAIATAMLAVATGSNTFGDGIVLGLVLGVGLALPILFVTGIFDPKKLQPMAWFLITGAYHVFGLLIVAAIVSVGT